VCDGVWKLGCLLTDFQLLVGMEQTFEDRSRRFAALVPGKFGFILLEESRLHIHSTQSHSRPEGTSEDEPKVSRFHIITYKNVNIILHQWPIPPATHSGNAGSPGGGNKPPSGCCC
jgi:hypothetical protein